MHPREATAPTLPPAARTPPKGPKGRVRPALDGRAHLCLAGHLPAAPDSLGAAAGRLPGLLHPRTRADLHSSAPAIGTRPTRSALQTVWFWDSLERGTARARTGAASARAGAPQRAESRAIHLTQHGRAQPTGAPGHDGAAQLLTPALAHHMFARCPILSALPSSTSPQRRPVASVPPDILALLAAPPPEALARGPERQRVQPSVVSEPTPASAGPRGDSSAQTCQGQPAAARRGPDHRPQDTPLREPEQGR